MDDDNALHTAAPDAHLAKRLGHLIDESDRLAQVAVLKGNHEYDVARDRLLEQIAHARRELAQFNDTVMYTARSAARRGDRAVREHPYAAIGLAAGIALMLGWLSRRR